MAVGAALIDVVYELTEQVFPLWPSWRRGISAEAPAVLWRVWRGFLDAALDAVDADHGGVEKYLRRRIGLSDAALGAWWARGRAGSRP